MKKIHLISKKILANILSTLVLLSSLLVFPATATSSIGDANGLVGVKVGDWVKYSFSINGPAFSGELEESFEWIRIDVQNVSGTVVTVHETTRYKNGNEAVNTRTSDLRTHSVGPYSYIIATNQSMGNRILIEGYEFEDPFHKFFINGTVSKQYLGTSREAYYSKKSFTVPFFWDHINITQEYCWDRETGFLLEHRYEGVFVGYENTTFSRWLMEIVDTNLWEAKTNPQLQPQPVWRQLGLLAFTEVVAGTVTVITFIKRRPKTNKKISKNTFHIRSLIEAY